MRVLHTDIVMFMYAEINFLFGLESVMSQYHFFYFHEKHSSSFSNYIIQKTPIDKRQQITEIKQDIKPIEAIVLHEQESPGENDIISMTRNYI